MNPLDIQQDTWGGEDINIYLKVFSGSDIFREILVLCEVSLFFFFSGELSPSGQVGQKGGGYSVLTLEWISVLALVALWPQSNQRGHNVEATTKRDRMAYLKRLEPFRFLQTPTSSKYLQ